ncbi:helicase associated domain-containing protein [Streptomyces sp. NPDC051546]|uniref:helicase associated domain-containing protein n=1 Tax=Streptomyces sp. NPDC051546 TaxID=3365655 RepID=UPI0037B0D7A7
MKRGTVDWQRHLVYLAEGARLTAIVPGATRHGNDIGRWLDSQRRGWRGLGDEQRERLGGLGVKGPARLARPP